MPRTIGQLMNDRTGRRDKLQSLYNQRRWREASKRFKAEHPLCVQCKEHGHIEPSYATDHIVPHNGNEQLFWDERNWQALCRSCHNRKSRDE